MVFPKKNCSVPNAKGLLHFWWIIYILNFHKNSKGLFGHKGRFRRFAMLTWNLFVLYFGVSLNPPKEGPKSIQNSRVIKGFQVVWSSRKMTTLLIRVLCPKTNFTPKWMVENNGKPYEQIDDLGGFPPIFGSTPIWWHSIHPRSFFFSIEFLGSKRPPSHLPLYIHETSKILRKVSHFFPLNTHRVGGWTNPSEKYALQIGNLPQAG